MDTETKENEFESTIYLDRIRVLASIFVVVIHFGALYFYNNPVHSNIWIIATFYNCLARIAVPLFVLVSGAIYLNENKEIPIKKLFLTIIRFVVMFFVWDILYQCFDYFVINKCSFNIHAICNILGKLDSYKYHLWYLLSYVLLLSLVPILRLICKKENRAQVKYLLLLFFVGACLLEMFKFLANISDADNIVIRIIRHIVSIIDLINVGKFSNLILIFIAGWYFSTFDFKNFKKRVCAVKWIVGLGAPVLTILLCLFTNEKGFDLMANYYYLPNFVLSVSVFLSFRYSKIANKPNKFLGFVGKRTLGIYLIHVFLIELLNIYILTTVFNHISLMWSIVIIPIGVVLVYVVSLLISSLLYFIPSKTRKWIC